MRWKRLQKLYRACWAGRTSCVGQCSAVSKHTKLASSSVICRSASFYPQPVENYLRKSTLGLAIDFPTLNVLGFCCYTISTTCFLYSPTIRAQYAYRHPDAPETTVRFNDFLFAAHGAVMTVIIYSQFFPRIWGFTVGRTQRVSQAVLAIFWTCVISVVIIALLAKWNATNSADTAEGWAWIDVVSEFLFMSAILRGLT